MRSARPPLPQQQRQTHLSQFFAPVPSSRVSPSFGVSSSKDSVPGGAAAGAGAAGAAAAGVAAVTANAAASDDAPVGERPAVSPPPVAAADAAAGQALAWEVASCAKDVAAVAAVDEEVTAVADAPAAAAADVPAGAGALPPAAGAREATKGAPGRATRGTVTGTGERVTAAGAAEAGTASAEVATGAAAAGEQVATGGEIGAAARDGAAEAVARGAAGGEATAAARAAGAAGPAAAAAGVAAAPAAEAEATTTAASGGEKPAAALLLKQRRSADATAAAGGSSRQKSLLPHRAAAEEESVRRIHFTPRRPSLSTDGSDTGGQVYPAVAPVKERAATKPSRFPAAAGNDAAEEKAGKEKDNFTAVTCAAAAVRNAFIIAEADDAAAPGRKPFAVAAAAGNGSTCPTAVAEEATAAPGAAQQNEKWATAAAVADERVAAVLEEGRAAAPGVEEVGACTSVEGAAALVAAVEAAAAPVSGSALATVAPAEQTNAAPASSSLSSARRVCARGITAGILAAASFGRKAAAAPASETGRRAAAAVAEEPEKQRNSIRGTGNICSFLLLRGSTKGEATAASPRRTVKARGALLLHEEAAGKKAAEGVAVRTATLAAATDKQAAAPAAANRQGARAGAGVMQTKKGAATASRLATPGTPKRLAGAAAADKLVAAAAASQTVATEGHHRAGAGESDASVATESLAAPVAAGSSAAAAAESRAAAEEQKTVGAAAREEPAARATESQQTAGRRGRATAAGGAAAGRTEGVASQKRLAGTAKVSDAAAVTSAEATPAAALAAAAEAEEAGGGTAAEKRGISRGNAAIGEEGDKKKERQQQRRTDKVVRASEKRQSSLCFAAAGARRSFAGLSLQQRKSAQEHTRSGQTRSSSSKSVGGTSSDSPSNNRRRSSSCCRGGESNSALSSSRRRGSSSSSATSQNGGNSSRSDSMSSSGQSSCSSSTRSSTSTSSSTPSVVTSSSSEPGVVKLQRLLRSGKVEISPKKRRGRPPSRSAFKWHEQEEKLQQQKLQEQQQLRERKLRQQKRGELTQELEDERQKSKRLGQQAAPEKEEHQARQQLQGVQQQQQQYQKEKQQLEKKQGQQSDWQQQEQRPKKEQQQPIKARRQQQELQQLKEAEDAAGGESVEEQNSEDVQRKRPHAVWLQQMQREQEERNRMQQLVSLNLEWLKELQQREERPFSAEEEEDEETIGGQDDVKEGADASDKFVGAWKTCALAAAATRLAIAPSPMQTAAAAATAGEEVLPFAAGGADPTHPAGPLSLVAAAPPTTGALYAAATNSAAAAATATAAATTTAEAPAGAAATVAASDAGTSAAATGGKSVEAAAAGAKEDTGAVFVAGNASPAGTGGAATAEDLAVQIGAATGCRSSNAAAAAVFSGDDVGSVNKTRAGRIRTLRDAAATAAGVLVQKAGGRESAAAGYVKSEGHAASAAADTGTNEGKEEVAAASTTCETAPAEAAGADERYGGEEEPRRLIAGAAGAAAAKREGHAAIGAENYVEKGRSALARRALTEGEKTSSAALFRVQAIKEELQHTANQRQLSADPVDRSQQVVAAAAAAASAASVTAGTAAEVRDASTAADVAAAAAAGAVAAAGGRQAADHHCERSSSRATVAAAEFCGRSTELADTWTTTGAAAVEWTRRCCLWDDLHAPAAAAAYEELQRQQCQRWHEHVWRSSRGLRLLKRVRRREDVQAALLRLCRCDSNGSRAPGAAAASAAASRRVRGNGELRVFVAEGPFTFFTRKALLAILKEAGVHTTAVKRQATCCLTAAASDFWFSSLQQQQEDGPQQQQGEEQQHQRQQDEDGQQQQQEEDGHQHHQWEAGQEGQRAEQHEANGQQQHQREAEQQQQEEDREQQERQDRQQQREENRLQKQRIAAATGQQLREGEAAALTEERQQQKQQQDAARAANTRTDEGGGSARVSVLPLQRQIGSSEASAFSSRDECVAAVATSVRQGHQRCPGESSKDNNGEKSAKQQQQRTVEKLAVARLDATWKRGQLKQQDERNLYLQPTEPARAKFISRDAANPSAAIFATAVARAGACSFAAPAPAAGPAAAAAAVGEERDADSWWLQEVPENAGSAGAVPARDKSTEGQISAACRGLSCAAISESQFLAAIGIPVQKAAERFDPISDRCGLPVSSIVEHVLLELQQASSQRQHQQLQDHQLQSPQQDRFDQPQQQQQLAQRQRERCRHSRQPPYAPHRQQLEQAQEQQPCLPQQRASEKQQQQQHPLCEQQATEQGRQQDGSEQCWCACNTEKGAAGAAASGGQGGTQRGVGVSFHCCRCGSGCESSNRSVFPGPRAAALQASGTFGGKCSPCCCCVFFSVATGAAAVAMDDRAACSHQIIDTSAAEAEATLLKRRRLATPEEKPVAAAAARTEESVLDSSGERKIRVAPTCSAARRGTVAEKPAPAAHGGESSHPSSCCCCALSVCPAASHVSLRSPPSLFDVKAEAERAAPPYPCLSLSPPAAAHLGTSTPCCVSPPFPSSALCPVPSYSPASAASEPSQKNLCAYCRISRQCTASQSSPSCPSSSPVFSTSSSSWASSSSSSASPLCASGPQQLSWFFPPVLWLSHLTELWTSAFEAACISELAGHDEAALQLYALLQQAYAAHPLYRRMRQRASASASAAHTHAAAVSSSSFSSGSFSSSCLSAAPPAPRAAADSCTSPLLGWFTAKPTAAFTAAAAANPQVPLVGAAASHLPVHTSAGTFGAERSRADGDEGATAAAARGDKPTAAACTRRSRSAATATAAAYPRAAARQKSNAAAAAATAAPCRRDAATATPEGLATAVAGQGAAGQLSEESALAFSFTKSPTDCSAGAVESKKPVGGEKAPNAAAVAARCTTSFSRTDAATAATCAGPAAVTTARTAARAATTAARISSTAARLPTAAASSARERGAAVLAAADSKATTGRRGSAAAAPFPAAVASTASASSSCSRKTRVRLILLSVPPHCGAGRLVELVCCACRLTVVKEMRLREERRIEGMFLSMGTATENVTASAAAPASQRQLRQQSEAAHHRQQDELQQQHRWRQKQQQQCDSRQKQQQRLDTGKQIQQKQNEQKQNEHKQRQKKRQQQQQLKPRVQRQLIGWATSGTRDQRQQQRLSSVRSSITIAAAKSTKRRPTAQLSPLLRYTETAHAGETIRASDRMGETVRLCDSEKRLEKTEEVSFVTSSSCSSRSFASPFVSSCHPFRATTATDVSCASTSSSFHPMFPSSSVPSSLRTFPLTAGGSALSCSSPLPARPAAGAAESSTTASALLPLPAVSVYEWWKLSKTEQKRLLQRGEKRNGAWEAPVICLARWKENDTAASAREALHASVKEALRTCSNSSSTGSNASTFRSRGQPSSQSGSCSPEPQSNIGSRGGGQQQQARSGSGCCRTQLIKNKCTERSTCNRQRMKRRRPSNSSSNSSSEEDEGEEGRRRNWRRKAVHVIELVPPSRDALMQRALAVARAAICAPVDRMCVELLFAVSGLCSSDGSEGGDGGGSFPFPPLAAILHTLHVITRTHEHSKLLHAAYTEAAARRRKVLQHREETSGSEKKGRETAKRFSSSSPERRSETLSALLVPAARQPQIKQQQKQQEDQQPTRERQLKRKQKSEKHQQQRKQLRNGQVVEEVQQQQQAHEEKREQRQQHQQLQQQHQQQQAKNQEEVEQSQLKKHEPGEQGQERKHLNSSFWVVCNDSADSDGLYERDPLYCVSLSPQRKKSASLRRAQLIEFLRHFVLPPLERPLSVHFSLAEVPLFAVWRLQQQETADTASLLRLFGSRNAAAADSLGACLHAFDLLHEKFVCCRLSGTRFGARTAANETLATVAARHGFVDLLLAAFSAASCVVKIEHACSACLWLDRRDTNIDAQQSAGAPVSRYCGSPAPQGFLNLGETAGKGRTAKTRRCAGDGAAAPADDWAGTDASAGCTNRFLPIKMGAQLPESAAEIVGEFTLAAVALLQHGTGKPYVSPSLAFSIEAAQQQREIEEMAHQLRQHTRKRLERATEACVKVVEVKRTLEHVGAAFEAELVAVAEKKRRTNSFCHWLDETDTETAAGGRRDEEVAEAAGDSRRVETVKTLSWGSNSEVDRTAEREQCRRVCVVTPNSKSSAPRTSHACDTRPKLDTQNGATGQAVRDPPSGEVLRTSEEGISKAADRSMLHAVNRSVAPDQSKDAPSCASQELLASFAAQEGEIMPPALQRYTVTPECEAQNCSLQSARRATDAAQTGSEDQFSELPQPLQERDTVFDVKQNNRLCDGSQQHNPGSHHESGTKPTRALKQGDADGYEINTTFSEAREATETWKDEFNTYDVRGVNWLGLLSPGTMMAHETQLQKVFFDKLQYAGKLIAKHKRTTRGGRRARKTVVTVDSISKLPKLLGILQDIQPDYFEAVRQCN